MAVRDSTGPVPAFPPSVPIRPTVIRGHLCYVLGDVVFTTFATAAAAWSAAEAHRFDIAEPIDTLVVQRTEALAEMRRAGADFVRFSAASKREAQLAVRIRRLRRVGGEA